MGKRLKSPDSPNPPAVALSVVALAAIAESLGPRDGWTALRRTPIDVGRKSTISLDMQVYVHQI